MVAIHEESSKKLVCLGGLVKQIGCGGVHRRYQLFSETKRERDGEISSKKNQSLESGCSFTPHTRRRTHDDPKLTLSPAAPIRELREAKEDSIEWKDGMYDVEQS